MKGVSIFYEFHDQGSPYIIAGIYSGDFKSEELMTEELLKLLNKTEFHEFETVTYINHDHRYGNELLGNEHSNKQQSLLEKFFPESLNSGNLPTQDFKFSFKSTAANKFVWFNRNTEFLEEKLNERLNEKAKEKNN